MGRATTLHVHRTFLYISFPFLHDYDVKMPHFAFYGGRKQATTKFFSLSELEYCPLKFSFRTFKTERTQILFLSDVLVAVPSLDLKVPFVEDGNTRQQVPFFCLNFDTVL